MARALRPVHHEQSFGREVAAGEQSFHPFADSGIGQRLELVEEWRDQRRIERQHQQLERYPRRPRVKPPQGTGAGHEPEHQREQRNAQHSGDQGAFRKIEQPQAQRHPVEAEALLDDERAIPRQRQRNEAAEQCDGDNQRDILSYGTDRQRSRPRGKQRHAAAQGEGEQNRGIDHRVDARKARARRSVVGGLVMCLQRDLAGEVRGHRRSVPLHMAHLPAREPQMQGDGDGQCDQEDHREQRCGIGHAIRRAEACARIAFILR